MAYQGIQYIGPLGDNSSRGSHSVSMIQESRKGGGGPSNGRVVPLRGPWSFYGISLKADLSQLRRVVMWVNSLDSVVSDPSIMGNVSNVLGNDFKNNFDSEGAHGGHPWRRLTDFTIKTRKARGFAAKPILHQSGQLKDLAAYALMEVHGRSNVTKTDRPMRDYPSDGRTTVNVSLAPRSFSASISGAKADNQISTVVPEGIGRYGAGFIPARPFWYLNDGLVGLAADSLVNRIMNDWATGDRNVVRTGYLNLGTMQGVTRRGR